MEHAETTSFLSVAKVVQTVQQDRPDWRIAAIIPRFLLSQAVRRATGKLTVGVPALWGAGLWSLVVDARSGGLSVTNVRKPQPDATKWPRT